MQITLLLLYLSGQFMYELFVLHIFFIFAGFVIYPYSISNKSSILHGCTVTLLFMKMTSKGSLGKKRRLWEKWCWWWYQAWRRWKDKNVWKRKKGRGNQFVETTKRSLMSASEKTKNFYIHIHNRHIWENESGESCCHTIRNSDITYLPHYPHQLPPPPLPFNRKNSEITSHGKLLKILLTPFRSSH